MSTKRGHSAVAVVTGARRGLGAALASELEDRGYRVAACALSAPVRAGVLCRPVDVADETAVDAFAAEVQERLGSIGVWINNAGVIGPIGLVHDVEGEAWRRCIEVNLLGTLHGCRAFLARCSPDGVLVNIASRTGLHGAAGLAAYSATKAAVIALTQSIAAERTSANAHVVVPPSVDTDMQRELLAQDGGVFPGVTDSLARRDAGAILDPREAARAILGAVLDGHRPATIIDLTGMRSSDPTAG